MKRKIRFVCLMLLFLVLGGTSNCYAQNDAGYSDDWYVGVGGGFNFNFMKFSDLDKERFPASKTLSSPVFSIFLQKEFGTEHNIVLRPQLSFLKRGGKLTEIDKLNGYADPTVVDLNYRLKAHFADFRLPILYQFGKAASGVRPYLGVTPVVGFPIGGNIRLQEEWDDFSIAGYQVDLNKKNFSSTYFAVAPTIGLRFNFRTGRQAQNVLFVNLEATYEIGLTDTYGSDEKDGNALDVVSGANYPFEGTRKFSGFGMQATIGIPFSAFKRSSAPAPVYTEPVIVQQVVEVQPAPEPEKPCYTLDEIKELINQHQSVRGKTICAISDINFDFAKSTLQRSSYPYLDQLAETIIKTNSSVEVKGHTDNVGSDEVNMKLSKERAMTVMKYLIRKGVSKDKISYSFYGASQPLTTNDTEEGRTMNRRVEFEILN
ncbi:MAG: OmpA family protein [Prevotella sp.]|nr:OmpA family protein [Prevotella sp.]